MAICRLIVSVDLPVVFLFLFLCSYLCRVDA